MLSVKDRVRARILVVDDDELFRRTLCRLLRVAQFKHIEVATNGQQALDKLSERHFDVCILDLLMPGVSGLEVIDEIQKRKISTDIVVLTGAATTARTVQAIQGGARAVLEKLYASDELIAAIDRLLKERRPLPHVLAERLDTYLQDHLMQADLGLKDLCQHFHISASYVTQLFRKHVKSTFRKRLAIHRIEKAKQLMNSTDGPLHAIAEQCGFKDYRRFYEAFVGLEKKSPKKYRDFSAGRRIK